MSRWRSIADFLALRRNTVLLLVALVLAGTGERLWLGFAPKYLETLGASVLIIGLFDALQTLLGAVYALTLLWAHSFAWLALALVVRGLKEFGEPGARRSLSAKPRRNSGRALTAHVISFATVL